MEKAEILFESYNMAVEESYNKIFMSNKSHELLNIEDETIRQHLAGDLEKWASTPMIELDGISPEGYFKSIADMAQLVELFKLAAQLCDNDIPDPLNDRLKTFNEDAVNELLALAADKSLLCDDDDQIISLMAIRTIGKWQSVSSLEPLIKLMFELEEDNEIVVEEICGTMIQFGSGAANRIIEILDESSDIGNLEEYLLDTLVKIGFTIKDKSLYDLIFRTIKSVFNKMDNKLFGAICLGNFGDGRAIPALRGFVEKNKNSIDYETFLEIKSSVHRLGGNMDDIHF
uniref:HEAT repeat domain-containing protein n=1 Tax=Acetivibrio cellulolyticus TaxID=35830 RepID=UPI0001E30185|nr:HEAT repeat domain-containing protein [Acetivibrio cellulolyticus]